MPRTESEVVDMLLIREARKVSRNGKLRLADIIFRGRDSRSEKQVPNVFPGYSPIFLPNAKLWIVIPASFDHRTPAEKRPPVPETVKPLHNWTDRERRLMQVWTGMFLAATEDAVFCAKSTKEKMEWVRRMLRNIGFPTVPCGSTWPYLTEETEGEP